MANLVQSVHTMSAMVVQVAQMRNILFMALHGTLHTKLLCKLQNVNTIAGLRGWHTQEGGSMDHPTLYEYQESRMIVGYDFYALIAAAFNNADNKNLKQLKIAFPGFFETLLTRYTAPGGLLEGEGFHSGGYVYTVINGHLVETKQK
jgi:hypothetical protein